MDEIMAAEEVSTWSGSRGVGEMVVEIMHMWVCYGVGGELDLLGVVVLVVGCRSRLRLRLRGRSQLLTDNEIFPCVSPSSQHRKRRDPTLIQSYASSMRKICLWYSPRGTCDREVRS